MRSWLISTAFLSWACFGPSTLQAADAKADLAKLTAIAEAALKAFNEEDAKTFVSLCSKDGGLTEEAFKKFVVGDQKAKYGKILEKQIVAKECVAAGDFPQVAYAAKCEKEPAVKVSVTFTKEGNEFRVMQVTFRKM